MYEYFLFDRQIVSRAGEERAEVLPRISYLLVDAIDRSVRSIARLWPRVSARLSDAMKCSGRSFARSTRYRCKFRLLTPEDCCS